MKEIQKLLVLAITLSFTIILYAQADIEYIGKYKYAKWGDEWYVSINGEKGSKVDIKHLVVSLKNGTDIKEFNFSRVNLKKLKDVRGKFAGGFFELEIPNGLNPFEVGKKLLSSGEFDHVYMNTYSKISDITPNDTFYGQGEHWNLDKIGMSSA